MSVILYVKLLFLVFSSCYGQGVDDFNIDQDEKVRWCTISVHEQAKCNDMKRAFSIQGFTPEIECIPGQDKYDCMQLIKSDQADLINLDSGDVFISGQQYSMVPIMTEQYVGSGTFANVIALLPRSNDEIRSLADLQDKKICFPGVGMSAWNVALAKLINSTIQRIDCNNYVKSAADFFGDTCAPNALHDIHNVGFNPSSICNLCGASNLQEKCTDRDPYALEEGAFQCLGDGAGDVAFVLHTTALDITQGETRAGFRAEDFEVLCLDGSRRPLDSYASCNWATVPSRAIMTLSAKSPAQIEQYRALLNQAQTRFGKQSQTFVAGAVNNLTDYDRLVNWQMYDSINQYGKRNLLFSDATNLLADVGSRNNLRGYLGEYKTNVIDAVRSCPIQFARWCVVSADERKKCDNMKRAFEAKLLAPELVCVTAKSKVECMRFIRDNTADMISLDGAEAYEAGRTFNMVPIAYEDYGIGDASYYAVAVTLKKDKETNLLKLRGRNSCHTGIGKSAGWIVPIGLLLALEQIRVDTRDERPCDIAYAVGQFFEKSCVPGALSPEFDPDKRNPPNLCSLCRGTGSTFCSRDDSEPYYGYSGALRCLLEGFGDVAFVRHSTVAENTDGQQPGIWIRGTISDDFELLCKDGTRAQVNDWRNCNLGKVPAHPIMTSADKSPLEKQIFLDLLAYGQQFYSTKHGDGFKMFVSPPGHHDLMFQDSTIRILPVGDRDTVDKWLGKEFITAVENILCVVSASTTTVAPPLFVLLLVSFMCAYWKTS